MPLATLSTADKPSFNRVSKAFEKAAEWLHGKKAFSPEMLSEPEPLALISATHDVLAEELGHLERNIPDEMARALDENIFLFSGFKTWHEMNDASRLLKDEDGGFKSFDRFLQDVQAIDASYNQNWLYAEYNFATASTQMAAKWADIERDGDEYDLQYRTAMDGLVRPEHAALEGITLPPSDKFWNEYYPPNGWNCRCTAVQVLKDKYPTSDSDQACAAGERATTQIGKNGQNKAAMFRFNPGKAGKVFPPKHPYLPKGCGKCKFTKLAYNPNRDECIACKEIQKNMEADRQRREANRKEYERLKKDPEYLDVEINKKGGVKGTHIRHEKKSPEKDELFFKELSKDGKGFTTTQLEYFCQDILYWLGNSAILCDEGIYSKPNQRDTALDLLLNGKRMDIRSVTSFKENYRNQLWGKNSQLGRFNRLPYVTEEADSVCLYFHDPSMYDPDKVKEGFEDLKKTYYIDKETGEKKYHTIRIRHIYCVINDGNGKGRKEVFDVE